MFRRPGTGLAKAAEPIELNMILLTTGDTATPIAVQGSPASPWAALLFAALTGLGMLIGVGLMRRFEGWAIRHTGELIAFAAGLLVSGALLHLIAGAIDLIGAGAGLSWTLGSFLLFYLAEAHFVPHVHGRGEVILESQSGESGHGHHGGAHPVAVMVALGLSMHSVVDGASVGAGLAAGALLGSVTAVLVVVHKLPVGIAVMSALYHSGFSGHRAALVSTGLAAITPLAVLLSYIYFRLVSTEVLGVLLALAGGSFLYVGAADLLPEGQARGRVPNTMMFVLGVALMAAIKLAIE
jgi:zinc transporter ZupT